MKTLSRIYTWLIFAFLYLPILILILFSFNSATSQSVFKGFSLRWYKELFNDTEIMNALMITLSIALLAMLAATIIGTLTAIGFHTMRPRTRRTMMVVNNIPMVNPEIVTGISLMLMFAMIFRFSGLFQRGYATLLIAHITFCIPYVVLQVLPKLRQMNKHTYEAALDLGCLPAKAFFKVVLPEIMPGVLTGALMAFTISLDDFVISLFTTGPSAQNLSITIYSMVKTHVRPKVNALSALMFGTVLILLLLVNVLQARAEKKQTRY